MNEKKNEIEVEALTEEQLEDTKGGYAGLTPVFDNDLFRNRDYLRSLVNTRTFTLDRVPSLFTDVERS